MLTPRERHGLREFYFTTNTSSEKVAALRSNPKASIYFVDRRFFRGISLAGVADSTPTSSQRTIPCNRSESILRFRTGKTPTTGYLNTCYMQIM